MISIRKHLTIFQGEQLYWFMAGGDISRLIKYKKRSYHSDSH